MDFKTAQQIAAQHGTPVLAISKSRIQENYRTLKAALPGVELFYAAKSNSLPEIISILDKEGCSFDLCTNGEIDILKKIGIQGSRCIHTHPIKQDHEIRYALEYGIKHFVVDNEAELQKFIPYKDKAELLVRIGIQNPASLVNLSYKFGIVPAKAFDLIQKAVGLGLKVAGISFHAGSQNENNLKYIEALEYCRDICRRAALAGFPLEIIDIGGGFPANYLTAVPSMIPFCQPINEYLDSFFSGYRIIAEPGRVLSATTTTLVTRVVGKSLRDDLWWYYLDDGIYNSFSGKIFDHISYPFTVPREGPRFPSVLAGPTCDSTDIIYENIALPSLEIGDILIFDSMGSYTCASATNFNGYPKAKTIVID
jgi:ornithine decarboxylase